MAKPTLKSVVFIVALLLAVVGVLFYRHATEPASAPTTQASLHPASTSASCAAFSKNRAPATGVAAMQAHAKQLADDRHYEQALAQYREIAAVDPGFPALNLEISRMLLKLGQPRLAKEAINTQIEVSECLPHLPLDSMDEYCQAHNFPTTLACVKELNSDQQSAYLQAALVQMELGRGLSHEPAAEAATTASGPTPAPRHAPAAAALRQATHPLLASRTPATEPQPKPIKHPNPNQLASGNGTDAALGAYAK